MKPQSTSTHPAVRNSRPFGRIAVFISFRDCEQEKGQGTLSGWLKSACKTHGRFGQPVIAVLGNMASKGEKRNGKSMGAGVFTVPVFRSPADGAHYKT
mmetsp:Transcript_17273/g.29835  ORF Transcript_17273/g.29835 Transcript_17273/m.29835 type:complete len:98 (+) Transcript_17273:201-494(+)